jgi:hypothetical protein
MAQEKCLLQPVVTVATNVKYHSNQKTTDLYIAENVSKSINLKNAPAVLDLAEDQVMAVDQVMAEDQVIEAPDSVEMIDQEKCLLQPVVTVATNVKYHSNQKTTDLYIAENVSKITDKTSKLF